MKYKKIEIQLIIFKLLLKLKRLRKITDKPNYSKYRKMRGRNFKLSFNRSKNKKG